ncbi:MAG: L-threonylcarbamoyladenylate synthase [Mycobacteriales bacterium]|jgi:L-threonylcarbamoyladenylate synthase
MRRYDCAVPDEREQGLREAVDALRRAELVVLPTDTVYGVGADAFTPRAVDALLAAKGRGRDMPVPVLVGSLRTLEGVVDSLPPAGRELAEAFWPGALTLVARHTVGLAWDLGDTRGTVAVRMPLHPVALELLAETGPLAVSSANFSGSPPARDVEEAQAQLGDAVEIYLDAGPCGDGPASTIVDLTGEVPRVLRAGAVPLDSLRAVLPALTASD